MKRSYRLHTLWIAFYFVMSCISKGQVATTQEQAVMNQDKLLNELMIKHDTDKAKDIYADNFVLTTSSGKKI